MEGVGRLWMRNGDSYEGEWRRGLFHGKGIYTYKNQSRLSAFSPSLTLPSSHPPSVPPSLPASPPHNSLSQTLSRAHSVLKNSKHTKPVHVAKHAPIARAHKHGII